MSKIIFGVKISEPLRLTERLDSYINKVSKIKNDIANINILYTPGKFSKNRNETTSQGKKKNIFERYLEKRIKKILDKKSLSLMNSIDSQNESSKIIERSLNHLNTSAGRFQTNPNIVNLKRLNVLQSSDTYIRHTLSLRTDVTAKKSESDLKSSKQSKLNLFKQFKISKHEKSSNYSSTKFKTKGSMFSHDEKNYKQLIAATTLETDSDTIKKKENTFNKKSVNQFISFLPRLIKHSEDINKGLIDCSQRYNRKNNNKM